MVEKQYQYPRLPDDEFQKLTSDAKREIGKIMSSCFSIHGLDIFIPGATEAAVHVLIQYGMAIRGKPNQEIKAPDMGRYNADD